MFQEMAMSAALANAFWLVCDKGISDEDARDRFERKFGYAPEKVIRDNGYVWIGPVSDENSSRCLYRLTNEPSL